MPLFLLFLAIPLLEIAAFILIGGEIGIGATMALIVLTAFAGTFLLRHQGLAVLGRIRADLDARRMPAKPLVEGAMIAAAGLLLLTPGFITDTIGFALFAPPVRTFLWRLIGRHLDVRAAGHADGDIRGAPHRGGQGPATGRAKRPEVIDLDTDDYTARPDPDSPWREPEDR